MSAITLAWVASIKVGNQTAKQLLQFYASHNFNLPGYSFKVKTLADQLEVSERSIQKAHALLLDKGFIVIEKRFNEDGRQLTNQVYLNVPPEFISAFLGEKTNGGEGERNAPPRVNEVQGEGERNAPLYNNKINNNKNNKSFYRKKTQKAENEKKHDFAESMNQMASEAKHIAEHEARKRAECQRSQAHEECRAQLQAMGLLRSMP